MSLLRGHLEGLCFLEPLNGFEYVNLETELNCFNNKNIETFEVPREISGRRQESVRLNAAWEKDQRGKRKQTNKLMVGLLKRSFGGRTEMSNGKL